MGNGVRALKEDGGRWGHRARNLPMLGQVGGVVIIIPTCLTVLPFDHNVVHFAGLEDAASIWTL